LVKCTCSTVRQTAPILCDFRLPRRCTWDCDFTQHRVVIPYRRFGPTYWTHHQGSGSSADASEPIVGDGTDRLSRKVGTVLPHELDLKYFARFVSPLNLCLIPQFIIKIILGSIIQCSILRYILLCNTSHVSFTGFSL
jgi:hypothetical protein